jgi:Fe-Mn family superoxide dismutase
MRDYLATERAKYLDAFLKNVKWEALDQRMK